MPTFAELDKEAGIAPINFESLDVEANATVNQEAMGLKERINKQVYNKLIASPIHELAKSDVAASEIAAYDIQKIRISQRKQQGIKFSERWLEDEFKDIVNQLHQAPEVRESEDLRNYPQTGIPDINPLIASVPAAKTLAEKGIDIGTNIAAVVAQIILLRKILPPGTSEPVIWEVQSQMTGGKLGTGAAYGALLGSIGKLNASQLAKATAEAATFYTTARLQGAEPGEALAQAAVPAVLRGIGAGQRALTETGFKLRSKYVPDIIERGMPKLKVIDEPLKITEIIGKAKKPAVKEPVLRIVDETPELKVIEKPVKSFHQIGMEGARKLYDELLEEAAKGNRYAVRKLNEYNQGLNLPTYDKLLEMASNGSSDAAARIQNGVYAKGPNASIAGFKEAAIKKYKLKPYEPELKVVSAPEIRAAEKMDFIAGKKLPKIDLAVEKPLKVTEIIEPSKMAPLSITAMPTPETEATGLLIGGLKKAKRLNKAVIEKLYHNERAKRAFAAEDYKNKLIAEGMPVGEALMKSRAITTGRLLGEIPTYEAPNLTPAQWESLTGRIANTFAGPRKWYSATRGQEALNKLRVGKPLQNNEIELLGQVFGPDFVSAAEKLQPWQTRTWRTFEDAVNLPKVIASFDIQMRRQARWVRAKHPILYLKSVGKDIGGYFSAKYADKIKADYTSSIWHEQARKSGTVFLGESFTLERRPEQFRTRLLGKVPLIGRAYKASERGFRESFNWMQQKLYDYKMEQFAKEGRTITPEMQSQVSDFNNTILGMKKMPFGSYGAAAARALSPIMWSPTLTASRLRTPSMILTNPTMRWETASTLATFIGSGVLELIAAQKFGQALGLPIKVEWDLRSSDVGKVQIKNTRFDMFGDAGPYIRMLAQFIWGQKKTQMGRIIEQPRIEAVWNTARNKRSAWIDAIWTMFGGKTAYGAPYWTLPEGLDIKSEKGKLAFLGGKVIVDRCLPFFIQSCIETSYNDGWPIGLLALTEEFFSGSVLSYKPSKYVQLQNLKDIIADLEFNNKWDDLTDDQQKDLSYKYTTEIEQAEKEAKLQRYEWDVEPTVSLEEQRQAGKDVMKGLNKQHQQIVRSSGVVFDVSRYIGDWRLNDQRYKQYKRKLIDSLTKELNDLPKDYDTEDVEAAVSLAKTEASLEMRT